MSPHSSPRVGRIVPRQQGVQPSELRSAFLFAGRNWRFALACCALMLVVGLAISLAWPDRYTATTSLVIENRRPSASVEQAPSTDNIGYVDTQILTIGSDLILGAVVHDLGLRDDPEFSRLRHSVLGELRAWLHGKNPEDKQPDRSEQDLSKERAAIAQLKRRTRIRRVGASFVVEVEVTSIDPDKSALIANTIASKFVDDQRRLTRQITERANAASTTRVIGPAMRPLERSVPGTAIILAVFSFVGLAGGAALAAIREILDGRLQTETDVENATGLPCLGIVPFVKRPVPAGASATSLFSGVGLLRYALDRPLSDFSEVLRWTRLFLEESKQEGQAAVVGIGASHAEAGCSTIAANLAALLAAMGRHTLIIDANTATPRLSLTARCPTSERQVVAPEAEPGVLQGVLTTSSDYLHLLTLGTPGPGGAAASLAEIVEVARTRYDFILVDLPILRRSARARELIGPLSVLILVAEWACTKQAEIEDALRFVIRADVKVLAVLLNKAKPRSRGVFRRHAG